MDFDGRLTSVWEWARAGIVSAALVWTTLGLGGALPESRVVTVSLVALLLVVHLLDPTRRRSHPAGWLLLPFLAYAAINVAWVTPVRWLGWLDWFGWAQAVAVFWVVLNGVHETGPRRLIFWVLAALGVTAAGFACYQHFGRSAWLLHHLQMLAARNRSGGLFGISSSLAALMLLLIPPLGALAIEREEHLPLRLVCLGALAALGMGFILAVSRGAWIALAVALAVKPFFDAGRSLARRMVRAVVAGGFLAAAGGALYAASPYLRTHLDTWMGDPAARARPILWRGAWRIFVAGPWLGGGAGSFDARFEHYRPGSYQDQPVWAHNDYLNTLADYGLVGFLLLFGAAAIIVYRCRAVSGMAAAIGVGLIAFALHLFVEFHLKIPALALVFATLSGRVVGQAWLAGGASEGAAAASAPEAAGAAGAGRPHGAWHPAGILRFLAPIMSRKRPDPDSGRRRGWFTSVGAAGVVALITIGWIIPRYRAEDLRTAARGEIDRLARGGAAVAGERPVLRSVRADLDRAVALDPADAQAWSDRAYAESLWALVDPAETRELGAAAERDASRALALSRLPVEFWIRRGTGLDMEGRWPEAGQCFVTALNLAPARADVWYYDAYHLSLVPASREAAQAAVARCLSLDPGYRLGRELGRKLATAASGGT
jgi:O-antigen ligase